MKTTRWGGMYHITENSLILCNGKPVDSEEEFVQKSSRTIELEGCIIVWPCSHCMADLGYKIQDLMKRLAPKVSVSKGRYMLTWDSLENKWCITYGAKSVKYLDVDFITSLQFLVECDE